VRDYAPEILDAHASAFPAVRELTDILPRAEVFRWDVPEDCTDWFMAGLWSRPELYLRPDVRAASSVWHQLDNATVDAVVARLAQDLQNGLWDERHGDLRTRDALDVGVRIIRSRLDG